MEHFLLSEYFPHVSVSLTLALILLVWKCAKKICIAFMVLSGWFVAVYLLVHRRNTLFEKMVFSGDDDITQESGLQT